MKLTLESPHAMNVVRFAPLFFIVFFPAALPPSVGSVSQERQGTALCPYFTAGCFSGPAFVRWRLKEHSSLLQEALALQYIGVN